MGPRISGLSARISKAEEVVERRLVDRFYTELDKVAEAERDKMRVTLSLPLDILKRMGRNLSEIHEKKMQERTLEDYLLVFAGLGPDLLPKVIEGLGWGQAELAQLGLTESFAWRADGERSEVGRLLVKLNGAVASYYPDPPKSDDSRDGEDK